MIFIRVEVTKQPKISYSIFSRSLHRHSVVTEGLTRPKTLVFISPMITGILPFSGSSTPINCRNNRKLTTTCTSSSGTPAKQFQYSRASPSVRWPDLRLEDFAPALTPSKPQFPVLDVDKGKEYAESTPKDAGFDENGEEGDEMGVESSAIEAAEKRSGRIRMKKMTKLALKRAKDWRQRVQFMTEKILALDSGKFVADVIDEKEVQMTPTDYCFVVKQVGLVSWQRALEVYEWLSLRRWYSPNARMVATILSVLGRARQDSIAEEVFVRATDVDGDVESDNAAAASVQVYNAMMGVYAKSGQFEKVKQLLELMRRRGCEPDLVSFNTLINARSKSGHMPPGSALELLGEVRRSGFRPDTVTYNTLISSCSHGSNLEEAIKVYEDMVSSKCQPDIWTYNAMVSVYGRCGRTREAELLFGELGRMGFSPDAVTYNSLMYAFAKDGNVKEVDRICSEMVAAGFRKDEITYNTTIHMYGKQGRHELAVQAYEDMKLSGCKPDAITYTVLIDSLGKADRVSEAANMMLEMVDFGVRPTLKTFSALICGYAKAGMQMEAVKTFDHMVRSGIKPDNQAYSVILDTVLRSGDTRKAIVLYKDMLRNEFKPDEGLYQVMLKVFAKDGRDKDVEDLVNDMSRLCRMGPKTISLLLVKAECFDLGTKMFKEAIMRGDEVDREHLYSLMDAYSSSGRYEEASALLEFLKEYAPNSHDLITEASVLILCRKGNVKCAINEYNELSKVGFHSFSQSCSIYESLITCCEEKEYFSEACMLFSDLKFYGVKPSQNIYRILITMYCKLGFPETAHCLLHKAERAGFLFNDLYPHVELIEAYGKLKLLQMAESVVGKLRLQRTVERKVWNALICAYAESGHYEQARAVFNTMMKEGPYPSVDSVNGLLQALIVDGRLNELYVVVEELQDMDFKISKSSILLMLDAFARAGKIFEVKKIYNGMKAAGYFPSMHLYRSMISLFSHGKRVRDAESMVMEMEQAGFRPDLSIFNSLLRMYTGIEDFRKAADVYQRVQELGLQANEETYSSLILMYSRDRRPEEGLSLLNEMKKKDMEPKLDTYKSLLASCGREQLLEQAEDLFRTIRSKGGQKDRSVYHTMMKIYRDSGDPSKAELVLSQMKEAGLQPTIATMHMLMDTYGTGGQPAEADNVLNNLINSGMDPSTLPYSSVIDAYLKNGDNDMAINKLLDMKKDGIEPDHRIWTCFLRGASLCRQTSDSMRLLSSISDSGFELPLRLLTEKAESLVRELDNTLDQIGSEDNGSFNFVNALEDLLWAFERRATASWIFQLAIKRGIYRRDLFRVADGDWGADFRKLSAGAALVGLTLWLDHMQDASLQGYPESPKSVVLITGTAEYHMVSLNNTLKAYLWEMGSPFLPCKTRTGLLVAKAHSLRMWLKDSSFCMDLELKDAPSLPEFNSMQLTEGYFMRAGLVPAFKDINERLGEVRPKKFARLALLSDERREKIITADIEGTKQKLEKMKERGALPRAKKPTRLRTGKIMRRQHKAQLEASR